VKTLSRILGWTYFDYAIAVPSAVFGHTVIAYGAWTGSKALLAMMIVFWCTWTVLALFLGVNWRRTLHEWGRAQDAWQETNELVGDYSSLLVEALDGLSTYDREKADDISARATTISVLRVQNIKEKLHD